MKFIVSSVLVASLSLTITQTSWGMARKAPQSVEFIQAESTVPQEQIEALRGDLQWLGTLNPQAVTPEFLSTLEVSSASPEVLASWLDERVNYLIAEDYQIGVFSTIRPRLFSGFKYPQATELPDIELPKLSSDLEKTKNELEQGQTGEKPAEQEPKEKRKATVVMSNLGTGSYLIGKMLGTALQMKIRGIGWINVTSPRIGVIQVGEGLFMSKILGSEIPQEASARKAFRMSTFFHEARHSDGNGKSMGFTHALCPEGHDLENLNGCDRSTNGPYTVGALISEHMAKSCADCTEKDREIIRILALDSRNRIIPAKDGSPATAWNAAHEGEFTPKVKKVKTKQTTHSTLN